MQAGARKRVLVGVLLIAVVTIAVGFVSKDMIARAVIVKAARYLTGLELSIERLRLGISDTLIDIRGLKIYNPKGFSEKIMADFPEIYIDYSLGALLKSRAYFPKLELHLNKLIVEKNSKGLLNINSIKTINADTEKAEAKSASGGMPIRIDSLRLKIGKVVYKDYTKPPGSQIKEFNINLNEKYENITDMRQLVSIIIMKALTKTAIGHLVNFDMSLISEHLPPGLKQGAELLSEGAARVKEITKDGLGSAGRAIKDTARSFGDVFKFPAKDK